MWFAAVQIFVFTVRVSYTGTIQVVGDLYNM